MASSGGVEVQAILIRAPDESWGLQLEFQLFRSKSRGKDDTEEQWGCFAVVDLRPNSPAFRAPQLQIGDFIVGVNGERIASATREDFAELLSILHSAGTVVLLTVARGGKPLSMNLHFDGDDDGVRAIVETCQEAGTSRVHYLTLGTDPKQLIEPDHRVTGTTTTSQDVTEKKTTVEENLPTEPAAADQAATEETLSNQETQDDNGIETEPATEREASKAEQEEEQSVQKEVEVQEKEDEEKLKPEEKDESMPQDEKDVKLPQEEADREEETKPQEEDFAEFVSADEEEEKKVDDKEAMPDEEIQIDPSAAYRIKFVPLDDDTCIGARFAGCIDRTDGTSRDACYAPLNFGDVLIAIDDKPVLDLAYADILAKLRRPPPLTLNFVRAAPMAGASEAESHRVVDDGPVVGYNSRQTSSDKSPADPSISSAFSPRRALSRLFSSSSTK